MNVYSDEIIKRLKNYSKEIEIINSFGFRLVHCICYRECDKTLCTTEWFDIRNPDLKTIYQADSLEEAIASWDNFIDKV